MLTVHSSNRRTIFRLDCLSYRDSDTFICVVAASLSTLFFAIPRATGMFVLPSHPRSTSLIYWCRSVRAKFISWRKVANMSHQKAMAHIRQASWPLVLGFRLPLEERDVFSLSKIADMRCRVPSQEEKFCLPKHDTTVSVPHRLPERSRSAGPIHHTV